MQVEVDCWKEYKIGINLPGVVDSDIFPFVDFIELPTKILIINVSDDFYKFTSIMISES